MSESEHPLTECYVAFLDLMGVRSLAGKAAKDSKLSASLVSALNETRNISTFYQETVDLDSGSSNKWSLQVQAFSDCVVMFIPTVTKMLPWLLASVRRLHDRLLKLDVPIRGGITVGEMYWDTAWDKESNGKVSRSTPVAFGPGLIAAYDLENATAVYPRLLFSSALYRHVEEVYRLRSSKPLGSGKLLDFLRQDADGLYHFDVLHADINRKEVIRKTKTGNEQEQHSNHFELAEPSYSEWLEQVRQFIERGRQSVDTEKLEAKYMWLANYYNEKAKVANGKLIHWFKNLIPPGTLTLAIKPRDTSDDS